MAETPLIFQETIESYKDFSGPEDELPYVVRVARRGELPSETLAHEPRQLAFAGFIFGQPAGQ